MADRYWVGGSGTWDTTNTTNWSETSGGAGGASVPTSADNVFFDNNSAAGNYTVTTSGALAVRDLNIDAPAGGNLTTTGTGSFNISGNLNCVAAGTAWSATPSFNFTTAGNFTITTSGVSFNGLVFNNASGTFTLQDTVNLRSNFQLAAGTLNVNGQTVNSPVLNASGAGVRTFNFTGGGTFNLSGSSTTVINMIASTNATISGTSTVNLTYSGSTGTRIVNIGAGATGAFNINVTAGSDTVTISSVIGDLNFAGFSGTLTNSTRTVFGNLTFSPTMTVTSAASSTTTLAATSGIKIIETNGTTAAVSFTVNAANGTYRLANNLSMWDGSALTLFTLTAGNLDLNDQTLTTGLFNANGSVARTIQFGNSGVIDVAAGNTTVWNVATANNFSYTGTPNVTFSSTANTGTRTLTHGSTAGTFPANLPPPFNFTAGTDTIATTTGGSFNSLDFTGFSGTLTNTARAIYGNFILSPTMTLTGGTSPSSFTSSATQIVDTANLTIPFPLFVGSGGAGSNGVVQLANALTLTSANTLTLTSGTLTTGGYPVSTGLFNTSGNLYRVLDISNNTLDLTGTGIVFTAAISSNLTLNTANSTVLLSNDTTAARTFVTGNQTYNNVVIGGNTATSNTTFTGNATFNTLSSTKTVAHTVRFTAGSTTTVDAFEITGTAGNVVTITSDTANVHNLVYTGAGNVDVSWANISYSNASPANTWFALITNNNINSGNNTGWVFGDSPVSSSNFFLLF